MTGAYKRSQRRAAIKQGKQVTEPVNPKAFQAEVNRKSTARKKGMRKS